MKRVAILTLHCVNNYGSVLQTLATQLVFKKMGCECYFIDYIRENCKKENLMMNWKKNSGSVVFLLKKIILYPTLNTYPKVFRRFIVDNVNLTKRTYYNHEELKKIDLDVDIFCIGSDQVWNSTWNGGILTEYFLDFVSCNIRKIAFASSFGKTEIDSSEEKVIYEYLKGFHRISVREESGTRICNKMGLENVTTIIDPTLVVDHNIWRTYFRTSKRALKENYILIYQLNSNREFDLYAKRISKKMNMKLVRVCWRYDQFYKSGHSVLLPSPNEFLELIANANYVLTDSFHATSFALNFNVNMVCVLPEKYNCRISDFLQIFNLQSRILDNYDNYEIIDQLIDFEQINIKLQKYRETAYKWIEEAIRDEDN